jgi:hypothetical protein
MRYILLLAAAGRTCAPSGTDLGQPLNRWAGIPAPSHDGGAAGKDGDRLNCAIFAWWSMFLKGVN